MVIVLLTIMGLATTFVVVTCFSRACKKKLFIHYTSHGTHGYGSEKVVM
jgi:hypothetical protein